MNRRAQLALAACVGSGCIIPDRDIKIDPGIDNLEAVRIVERAPQLEEMHEQCNIFPLDEADTRYCPEVPHSLAAGLVAPSEGSFCVCPEGSTDRRGLSIDKFQIYAEDLDRDRDGPKDQIYGVALLDPESHTDPTDAAAYANYWRPCREGVRIDVSENEAGNRVAPPVGRTVLQLTVFPFDDQSGSRKVDLCNDDSGDKVSPGLHTLRFMVTDRPFFTPIAFEQTGEPGNEQCGVPDLAAGATYATVDFVFECLDANDPDIKAHDDEQRACTEAMELAPDAPAHCIPEALICDCTDPEQ